MHNTSNEYKQMHNKIISRKWQLSTNIYLFRGLTPSSAFFFIIFFIQKSSFLIQMLIRIRGSSRIEFFIFLIAWGIFFESWSLDLQFLPSFLLSYHESSFFFYSLFPDSAKGNHFLQEHIPWMNESHDLKRPFKVVITTSAFSTSSATASSCSFIWETLVKYDSMVFAFFTFFNWFLEVIFWFMFFPSNILVKESKNI